MVNTSIPKYNSGDFHVSYDKNTNLISFSAPIYNKGQYGYCTGYQIYLYRGSNCLRNITSQSESTDYYSVSKDKVYKYKIRGYYTNPTTKKTIYGPWSDYKYFALPSGTFSTKRGVRGAKVTLKRVSDISKYIIYVSTSSKSGYKKTMTVTVPSSVKKKVVSLTKIGSAAMKKGKTYYVRIVPYIKTNSGIVRSESNVIFNFRNNK